ncbi:hypothetical protein J437_LFUL009544 [Ladona fulva]|uniref:RING-type domain-containing protein n=1 Tax=Ladona fulva TaxID=123851 RepID=A0A8K0K5Y9_LADFU|nr:hypothetical protein J437_LFUL009544 [Ladona fulva]
MSNSTGTVHSVAVERKEIPVCQDSKESFEDIIKTLEDENKGLQEHVKTQEGKIRGMENEIKTLNDRFNTVNKDLGELQRVNEKQRESEAINEEIVETLIKETNRKVDSELSLQEAINSITEECSSLKGSEASLQESIKIILDDLERVQNREIVLNETIKRYEDETDRRRESQMCIVCMTTELKVVFIPCGHLVTCSDCSRRVNQCPSCRQHITSRVNIFRQN